MRKEMTNLPQGFGWSRHREEFVFKKIFLWEHCLNLSGFTTNMIQVLSLILGRRQWRNTHTLTHANPTHFSLAYY